MLSLISSISKKAGEVVVTVEVGVSFVIDGSEADEADLGLKIRIFATARFCFIKTFFYGSSPTTSSELLLRP